MDTHYNIHARACGCEYRCVDGRRKGKEWERKGHTTYVSGEFRAHPDDSQNTYNRVLQNCCHCYHPFY